MMDLKLVIFDMDGLMFDTERIARIAYKETGEKYDYTFNDCIFQKITGASCKSRNETFIETFGENFPLEAALSYKNKIFRDIIKKDGVPIKPGLLELIKFLKENKIKMAVASSSRAEVINYYLTMTGITGFDFIISGEDIKESKPNPEIFLTPCEKLDVDTDNAIVLEDSTNGINASLNAGIKPIWVPDLIRIPDELMSKIFAKAGSLLDVIDIINKNFNI